MTWPNMLMLSDDDDEGEIFDKLLQHVALQRVRSFHELRTHLQSGNYDAMLCGWSFCCGTRNQTLECLRQYSPDIPVVFFGGSDAEEWEQVLAAETLGLLITPGQKSGQRPGQWEDPFRVPWSIPPDTFRNN